MDSVIGSPGKLEASTRGENSSQKPLKRRDNYGENAVRENMARWCDHQITLFARRSHYRTRSPSQHATTIIKELIVAYDTDNYLGT